MGRHRIPTSNPNTDYLRGKAEAQLHDEGRIDDLCGVQDDPRATAELADWVAGFPEDAAWKPVLDEVAENWIYYDWEGMAREVPGMPAGRARDTMVAALLEDRPPVYLGGGPPKVHFPPGGLEKSRADELRTLISDPEIRQRFEEDP